MVAEGEPARRSRRAEETRTALLNTGREVFSRKPIAAVKLKKDILEPAGVSVGSFYHQFRDKGDLLVAILEQHSETMRQQFRELHRPSAVRSPDSIARDSYELVFDMVDQDTAIMRILLRGDDFSDPRIAEFNARNQLRWYESRRDDYLRIAEAYGIELDVEFAAELIGMLTDGAIRRYLAIPRSRRVQARPRLLRGLVQLTLRGLPGLNAQSGD